MGKIYYLMGKSASGKDHIYEHLLKETSFDLKPLVLYTTRPIRSGEQDGREYFFVDEKRLSELAGAGSAERHGPADHRHPEKEPQHVTPMGEGYPCARMAGICPRERGTLPVSFVP